MNRSKGAVSYYSWTGYRLRLWMRLYFIIGLILPKGFRADCKLKSPDDFDVIMTRTITAEQYRKEQRIQDQEKR